MIDVIRILLENSLSLLLGSDRLTLSKASLDHDSGQSLRISRYPADPVIQQCLKHPGADTQPVHEYAGFRHHNIVGRLVDRQAPITQQVAEVLHEVALDGDTVGELILGEPQLLQVASHGLLVRHSDQLGKERPLILAGEECRHGIQHFREIEEVLVRGTAHDGVEVHEIEAVVLVVDAVWPPVHVIGFQLVLLQPVSQRLVSRPSLHAFSIGNPDINQRLTKVVQQPTDKGCQAPCARLQSASFRRECMAKPHAICLDGSPVTDFQTMPD